MRGDEVAKSRLFVRRSATPFLGRIEYDIPSHSSKVRPLNEMSQFTDALHITLLLAFYLYLIVLIIILLLH